MFATGLACRDDLISQLLDSTTICQDVETHEIVQVRCPCIELCHYAPASVLALAIVAVFWVDCYWRTSKRSGIEPLDHHSDSRGVFVLPGDFALPALFEAALKGATEGSPRILRPDLGIQ